MPDTKTIRMRKHYTPQTGPRRGKTLFAARAYELDEVTAKEVVAAKAGGYTQKSPDAEAPAAVALAEPENATEKKKGGKK